MRKRLLGLLLAAAMTTGAAAREAHAPRFVTHLDHDGVLSAGWIQVLPALATACNLRFDNQRLTDKLVDLSRADGNLSYTRDLYTRLFLMEKKKTGNEFASAWTTRFDGRTKEACALAEALWGEAGDQFPGVLKREAMNDGTVVPPAAAPNCK